MSNNGRFLVGFDRFIALGWADFALELALRNDAGRNQKIVDLKDWLSIRVKGKDAARKTANVLTRLWIDTHPDTASLKSNAKLLYPDIYKDETIIFHWGMALTSFPFFRETVLQTGRILSLQGSFRRLEIQQRVMEHYSNQGTIPRSVDRVIQSLVDWKILIKAHDATYSAHKKVVVSEKLQAWLLEAMLLALPEHRILLNDLFRTPELFPFDFNGNQKNSIYSSGLLTIERDGTNLEFVVPSLQKA